MDMILNFSVHTGNLFIPVVVHNRESIHGGISISLIANSRFRRFEGGLLDD